MSAGIDISAAQMRAYLRVSGWEQIGEDAVGDSWALPSREDAPAILVPTDAGDRDYRDLVSAAVRRLAWTVDLPEDEIVRRILTTSDVLEVRAEGPSTAAGRISLERGEQLIRAVRQLVWNGARVTFAGGRPGYRGGLPDAAREVVDRLELAPPKAGSFQLEVYAPANPQLALEGVAPPDRAHDTLVAALRAVEVAKETVDQGIPEDVDALDDAVAQGVSTNLLNAMARFGSSEEPLNVEIRGRWSRPDPDAPNIVRLEPGHFSRFAELHDVLVQHDPREDFPLTGWIKGVAAESLAIDHPLLGTVVVEGRVEGTTREVRVELGGDDLRTARAVIGEGFLSAFGTLEKVGREWRLSGPRGVTIRTAHPPQIDE